MIAAAVFQVFDAIAISLSGALRGAGDTIWPGVVTIVLSWSCIVLGGHLFIAAAPGLGSVGPWIAAAASSGRVPRAPLAAQSDTAHAVPADSVIPAEITTAATQRPMCIHAVTFPQGEERAIDRDEVATRYRIRGDAHRPVSDRQEESDRKDAFTELADDIFAAW